MKVSALGSSEYARDAFCTGTNDSCTLRHSPGGCVGVGGGRVAVEVVSRFYIRSSSSGDVGCMATEHVSLPISSPFGDRFLSSTVK